MRNEEQYAAGLNHPNETIRAYIHGLPNHVVIRGISSLPVGTNIVIEVWTEDQGRLVGEHTVNTELDGHFTVQIEREDRSEDYLVSLKLMSHQQTKKSTFCYWPAW
ncbi:hypothetical protein [Bacillus coahuilensis]|uniref:hypothetical protein n=1 Tax=Bacillus coahuilensis TaxID=408580 RepID=UPI00018507D2|nr:hypothetical protein [Bacillus coahuilensis]